MRPERYRRLQSVLERRQPDLTVLMERVNKARNFAAILRNCDAVGVLRAHAVLPRGGVEMDAATAAGTHKWIRVREHPTLADAVRALRDEDHRIVAAHPAPHARDYRGVDYTTATAFLLGAELDGISEEGLRLADEAVTIPMVGMARSLNVSVATALLLFEAFRQRERAGMYQTSRLPPEERRLILFRWAYPRLAARFDAAELPYPALGDDGALEGPIPEAVRRAFPAGT